MKNSSEKNHQDFGSLSSIMQRFKSIPYEEFQRELQEWFLENLANEKNISENEIAVLQKIQSFTQSIYHQAEVLQTLVEAKIQTNNNED